MEKSFVIGIDLGGTKINGALADLEGMVLSKFTMPTNASEGEQAVLGRIVEVIETVIEKANKTVEEIKTIGIGSPGPLNAKAGIIVTTPNLPFRNFQLVKPIIEKFNIPTFLDNDANVAAIGEYMLGSGKGTTNMVYITVSTGIGGGAILDGRVYRGSTSNALEVGHMTIVPDGPRCNCGNNGCIEALASGTAIARQAREAIAAGLETSLSGLDVVTSYEVYKEAQAGDKVSKDILDKSFNYLGIAVASIITSFDPEMFVIGGGVSQMGDVLFDKVQQVVNKRCFKSMSENCKIVPAGLGTDAGVMGAVALALLESK
jgi:glucokinase